MTSEICIAGDLPREIFFAADRSPSGTRLPPIQKNIRRVHAARDQLRSANT